MKKIWIIAHRELTNFFNSLIAYIVLVGFLGLTGFFTWFYGSNIFMIRQASLQIMFEYAYVLLFLFIPALTMRLVAEEKRSGTLELLLTKPVTDWQVVLGKFLGTFLLIAITLAMTFPYYVSVAFLGPIDHATVWTGYIGMLFIAAVYISFGLFASSISGNQVVGFLLALFIGIFFHFIFRILSENFTGTAGGIFNYLNVSSHYSSMSKGVIDSKDILYFLTLIYLGLLGTVTSLSKRNSID
jgi:ABC-2 type transport system permease protein